MESGSHEINFELQDYPFSTGDPEESAGPRSGRIAARGTCGRGNPSGSAILPDSIRLRLAKHAGKIAPFWGSARILWSFRRLG